MTTSKDIDNELVEDLEATDEESESVKGGTMRLTRTGRTDRTDKTGKFSRGKLGGKPIHN